MDLPHVTVKAWTLHSGKAGLVGGSLLIYLCAESTLRYYRWVTSFLFDVFITWLQPCGVCLTDTGRNNKQRPCFRRYLLSEWLGFDVSEEAAALLLLTWVLPWHTLGLFWQKLLQELFKINGCLYVGCAASTQKRPHQTSPSETRLADLSPHWELSRRESIKQPMWLTCVQLRLLLTVNVQGSRDFLKENEISWCNIEHF